MANGVLAQATSTEVTRTATLFGHAAGGGKHTLTLKQGDQTVASEVADGSGNYRFASIAPGHYVLEHAAESDPAPCTSVAGEAKTCIGSALTVEPRQVELKPGEHHREDF